MSIGSTDPTPETSETDVISDLKTSPEAPPAWEAGGVEDSLDVLDRTLVSRAADARFRLARAIRNLLGMGKMGGVDAEEQALGAKSLAILAETIRNAAQLVDNLHELASAEVQLSKDISAITEDLVDLVTACRDANTLAKLPASKVYDVVVNLGQAANAVEKSETILELLSALAEIEPGVNNHAEVSSSEFKDLIKGVRAPTGPSPTDMSGS